MGKNSNSSNQKKGTASREEILRDEEPSPKLGELYHDLNEFAETKRTIEALIRLKQTLIEQDSPNVALITEELRRYRLLAMEAIDRLFGSYTPSSNKQ